MRTESPDVQSLLDAKVHKLFKNSSHACEGKLFTTCMAQNYSWLDGKAAKYKSEAYNKTGKYSLTSCQVPKMTHKMEFKTHI